jgi:hypothetical protein
LDAPEKKGGLMKFIAGVVVGFILANATAAFAISEWIRSGSQLMSAAKLFRIGYVSGASDMLTAVVTIDLGSKHEIVKLLKAERCLGDRSKAGLDQFTRWAERFFLGRDELAADILLRHACE